MLKRIILTGTFALCTALGTSAVSAAAPSPVTMVMVVEVGATPTATPAKLMELQKRGAALAKKAGAAGGVSKLYAPSLGGQPNQFVLVVEFPNIAAYAASETANAQNPEWQKLNDEARTAGFKLVSRSLVNQISP
jgi:hypothetical protein